jgi:hypothetical protein
VPSVLPLFSAASAPATINSGNPAVVNEEADAEEIPLKDTALSAEFLQACPQDPKWRQFTIDLSSEEMWKRFGSPQKEAILSNDQSINHLYHSLVPTIMSEDDFWMRWHFWRHLQSTSSYRPTIVKIEPINDQSPPQTQDDWESWD